MKKIIAALAIATLTTAPAGAQTSAAARAQQLQKLEEDLNSPDPNLRLAAFEVAMESSSIAIRTKALTTALSSSDRNLAAIAARFHFCQNTNVRLAHGQPPSDPTSKYNGFRSGSQSFVIQNCDPNRGSFSTAGLPGSFFENRSARSGSFNGESANVAFMVWDGHVKWECSATLRVDVDRNFSGTMACKDDARGFVMGPVAAKIFM